MKRVSAAEAAALIDRDPSWIRLLAARGQLRGWEKIGTAGWIGPEASVLAYAAKEHKPGRPAAKRPASRSA